MVSAVHARHEVVQEVVGFVIDPIMVFNIKLLEQQDLINVFPETSFSPQPYSVYSHLTSTLKHKSCPRKPLTSANSTSIEDRT